MHWRGLADQLEGPSQEERCEEKTVEVVEAGERMQMYLEVAENGDEVEEEYM